jgi:tRNA threonylcarbamoyladenosine biosynthesis protein TsaB
MRILAVDTCTRSCSVAVVDSGHLVAEVNNRRRETHSRHLMRMVDMALEISGMDLSEIDAFGVTRGPGSFTGLRIGISTVKGMALGAGKPVAGVSSLAALAWPVAVSQRLICAMIDAGKGEVYTARFRSSGERFDGGTGVGDTDAPVEDVLPPGDLLSEICEPCTFVGDGVRTYAGLIESRLGALARLPSDEHHDIRASSVARLALSRLRRGMPDPVAEFTPRYLRKSDAELRLGMAKKASA